MSASLPSPHNAQVLSSLQRSNQHEPDYESDDGVYPLPSDSQGNTSSHSHHVSVTEEAL